MLLAAVLALMLAPAEPCVKRPVFPWSKPKPCSPEPQKSPKRAEGDAKLEVALKAAMTAQAAVPPDPAPTANAVTIYVGPHVRDGFVDVDKGVLDSIKDIRGELRRNKAFRLVEAEKGAVLVLKVISRGSGPSTIGAMLNLPGAAITTSPGYTMVTPGISIPIESQSRHVDTILRVGSYERAFVAEAKDEAWQALAMRIAKDLAVWLTANHERIKSDTPAASAT